jgi:lysophospholipase L1-like esterase
MAAFVFTVQSNGTVTATLPGYTEVSANAASEGLARAAAEQQLGAAYITRRSVGYDVASPSLRWRTALANVRRGISNAKLAFVGDSTTAGTGSSGTTGKLRVNSYPAQISAMFTAYGITGGLENVFGTANSTVSTYNDKVQLLNGSVVTAGNLSIGGGLHQLTASTHTFAFTPAATCDTFDVYHVKTGGTGTSTINLDGGGTLATVTGFISGGGVVKTTVSGTLAAHTLNVVWSAGTNYVLGVDAYNSAVKQVSCWNLGASGATAAQIASTSTGYASKNGLATLAPDMTVICIAINDWNVPTDITTWKATMQSIIDTALISGDVMLVTPVPSGNATTLAVQRTFVDATYTLAADNAIRVVDIWKRWGSYTSGNAVGFYNDTLHPSGIGYADKAQTIFKALVDV